MKKTLAILMAIMMVFALSGCGTTKEVLSHPVRTTAEETTFTTSAIESIAESIKPEITEDVSSETNSDSIWPTTGWLSDMIPHSDYITDLDILIDAPEGFQANAANLSAEDFGDYKYQLTVCGWSTVLTSDETMFVADHEDGIHRVGIQINDPINNQTYIRIWEAH